MKGSVNLNVVLTHRLRTALKGSDFQLSQEVCAKFCLATQPITSKSVCRGLHMRGPLGLQDTEGGSNLIVLPLGRDTYLV